MSVDLKAGIVRILKPDSTTAGTGFVVSDEGLIATCAHVIQYAEAGPGDTVRIVFRATDEVREAEVEPKYWRGPDAEDVALLHLENLPEGVTPLPLGSSGGTATHPFKTFGFPEAKASEGMFGYGLLGDKTSEAGFPVLQLTDTTEVTVGFSGGPVLNTITRRVVGMVTSITRPDEYGRLTETAFIIPSETLREICPLLRLSDICPYRGLAAFTETDAQFFFGREKLVDDLVAHLGQSPRFLAVIGPSGSGKSSLVQAGLFPALRRGDVPGSQAWDLLAFRPGIDPFMALASVGLQADTTTELQDAAHAYLTEHPTADRLVLFADQFEEVFAFFAESVKIRFLNQLVALLDSNLPVTLILALRADFYGHLLSQRPLSEWLALGQVNILPMDGVRLQAAVEEPANRVGLHFEPGLAGTIVEEAGQIEHALPLLEAALTQLWEQREEGALTHAAYQRVGQVAGAITQWAEDTYSGLGEKEKLLAQRVFTRLLHYSEGDTADTRRRRPLAELVAHPQELEAIHGLVQQLADARLLVTDRDPRTGEETAEIIHDALLWEWGRLRLWVEEQRAFYLWRQRLDERLREWKDKDQDEGVLLRGTLLSEAEPWLSSRPEELNPEERRYIQDSVALRERERAARERLRRRIISGLSAGLLIALLLAIAAGLGWRSSATNERALATEVAVRTTAQAVAEDETRRAEQQTRHARSRQLAAQSQAALEEHPQRSLLLAMEALSTTLGAGEPRVPAAENALRQALSSVGGMPLTGHEGSIYAVAFSPDGRWLATGSGDGTARLWNTADPTAEPVVLRGHEDVVMVAAFSSDGRWLATGSADTTARLWDVADPAAEPVVLRGHEGYVVAVAFSLDGRYLMTGGRDGAARLHSVTDPATESTMLRGLKRGAWDIAFSPDGRWLATGSAARGSSENAAQLWDVTDPTAEPVELRGHEDRVVAVAFSLDGRWLATGSGDSTARVWDVTDPAAEPVVLRGHEGSVYAVAFNPDGRWLATGSGDGTARLWDVTNPTAEPVVLHGHEGSVYTVAFSPDGSWLATGSLDTMARLWNATDPTTEPVVLHGHEDPIYTMAFGPNGRRLATGGLDATVRLWDVTDPTREPVVLSGHEERILTMAFSPNGHWLATGGWDDTPRLWDMSDLATEPVVLRGNEGGVEEVAFSLDGRWLAAARRGATVCLWDMTEPAMKPVVLRGHEGEVVTVAFSPDERHLATGSHDNTARLWDVTDLEAEPVVLRGHEGPVYAVAFSPALDGRWLATGGRDTTTQLWDVTDPTAEPIVLQGHEGRVDAVAFSPDGRWLATGSADNTARLWDVADPEVEPAVLRGHEGEAGGVAFSPDGRWLVTWSGDGTTRLWDVADPTAEPIVLRGHEGFVDAAAFSPDGHWLATGGLDTTVRLWRLRLNELSDLACRLTGRNLTRAEWQQYLGDEPYEPTCPNLPVPEE